MGINVGCISSIALISFRSFSYLNPIALRRGDGLDFVGNRFKSRGMGDYY